MAERIAERQWHRESGGRDDERLQAGFHQAQDIGFESDFEQQQYDADFGQQPKTVCGFRPSEQARPEKDAGEQLADHCRSAETCHELSENARSKQNGDQNEKEDLGVHEMCAAQSRTMGTGGWRECNGWCAAPREVAVRLRSGAAVLPRYVRRPPDSGVRKAWR